MTDISTYIPYLIGFFGAMIASIVAYFLNTRLLDKEKKEQKIAVIKLINSEIERNLTLLQNFINDINSESGNDKEKLGSHMGSLPLPPFNDRMYNKFALLLPNSFDEESEFEKLYDFYRSIDDIKIIYNNTVPIVTESKNFQFFETKNTPPVIRSMMFGDSITKKWNEFEKISNKILKNSNPL